MPVDYRCYFVTGAGDPREVADRAAQAASGGAGVIQVRSKPISARSLLALARSVSEAVAAANPATRVLVDDRVDVALALMREGANVHGVHVGQDDLPVPAVRALLGPQTIIGLTTGTLELVRAANKVAGALDYVGCGPFRPTPTKDSGRVPLGVAGYAPIVGESLVPVVAIGDVTADDVAELAATGIAGTAIVRGIMNADSPSDYCATVLAEFERGRR